MNDKKYFNYFQGHYKANLTHIELKKIENYFYGFFEFIKNKINLDSNKTVLEIGVGQGGFLSNIQKTNSFHKIEAIELDPEVAQYIRDRFNVECYDTEIENFYPGKNYGYIFAFEVLEHVDDPLQALRSIYQLLEPGGYFIGSTPYPFKRNILADKTHKFVLHPLTWSMLLTESGFTNIKIYPASALPFFYRFSRRFSILFPFYVPAVPCVSTSIFIAQRSIFR